MKKRIKKAYLRYFISYLAILLLPICVLGVTTHWFITSAYIEETLEKNLKIPQQIQIAVDMQVSQMDNYAYQISKDKSFSVSYLAASTIVYDTTNKLAAFNLTNEFITDVLYYAGTDSNLYYSARGVYDPNILFDSIYQYENLNKDNFEAFSNANIKPNWIPKTQVRLYSGQSTSYATYIHPIYGSESGGVSLGANTFLIFLIKHDSFKNIIGSVGGSEDIINVVTNAQGELLFASQPYLDDIQQQDVLKHLDTDAKDLKSEKAQPEWKKIQLNGGNIYANQIHSDTGLIYSTLIPEDTMLHNVRYMQNIYLLVYAVLVNIGFFLVILISRYQYRPFKKLQSLVQGADSLSAESLVNQAEETIRTLRRSSLVYRQEHMLLKLLQDESQIYSEEELHEAGVFLKSPYTQSAIVVIKYHENDNVSLENRQVPEKLLQDEMQINQKHREKRSAGEFSVEERASTPPPSGTPPPTQRLEVGGLPSAHADKIFMLQEAFSQHGSCYAVKYMEENCFILVLSQERGDQESCLRILYAGIQQLESEGFTLSLYVGNAYSNISLLHQSFNEAKRLFSNRHQLGDFSAEKQSHSRTSKNPLPEDRGILHYYGSVQSKTQITALTYPKADLDALQDAITQNDIMLVAFLVKKISHFISREVQDAFLVRCVCYEAINCILHTMELKRPEWVNNVTEDITQNLSFSSVEDLILIFTTLSSQVIIDLEAAGIPEPMRKLSMSDAVAYINIHFCDPDFSVKALAADYEMTNSNFSHQFKKYTGKNVSEYINEKRMSHAKQWLRESTDSVAEIAKKSGYLHASSFIRKFKQDEGITPGEYQEQFRRQK